MVFGAIINWTVGKTLDLTFDTIWWITKKTGQGIYNAGHYLIISKPMIAAPKAIFCILPNLSLRSAFLISVFKPSTNF